MDDSLQEFLRQSQPQAGEITIWGDGQYSLRVVSYFGEAMPPLAFVTSVRGIVTDGQQVLVMRNEHEVHMVPGGRREKAEQLTETLRREILEEAGWLTGDYRLLGVWHFHHLSPKPPDFPYLYPDFLQLIYRTTPLQYVPEAKLADDYEQTSQFISVEEAMTLQLRQPSQLKFLAVALAQL